MKVELELYLPSEAEEITKVPQTTIRNWRRAGYLPSPKGHARYNLPDLLLQTSMQALVSRGILPEVARTFAGEIARAIFQSMIYSHKTFSPKVYAAAQNEVGEIPQERVARVKAALGEAYAPEVLELLECSTQMRKTASQAFGLAGMKTPSWVIIWANSEIEFYYSGDDERFDEKFFGDTSYGDPYTQGPIILFSMGNMAQMVLDRLPRPAIRLASEGNQ
ncbi:MAG: MerR family transcriptional regulator [Verrucomicrobiota bacterium]